MKKQEFLNMGWNGLFVMLNDNPFKIYGIEEGSVKLVGSNDFIRTSIKNVTPAIRHLDTLTQECVQADYNNGEPFIPIVELARMAFPRYSITLGEGFAWVDTDWDNLKFIFNDSDFNCEGRRIVNQLQLFQQLIRWHYWPNMPEGEEVVYVTNEFNPYK